MMIRKRIPTPIHGTKRLKDVIAEHEAKYAGLSLGADMALHKLSMDCAHYDDMIVTGRRSYRDYKRAIHST
jgi:hypothetical protein